MKKMKYFFVCILALGIVSCHQNKQLVKITGFAQGTTYAISYYNIDGTNYQQEIDSIFKTIDKSVSIYDSTSLISHVNKSGGKIKTDKYFEEIFHTAEKVSKETNGAFDVTVGPLVNAFGFGFKNKEKISDTLIDSLKKLVDYRNVKIQDGYFMKNNPAICIDFNAIAQGYTVDIISRFLESKDVDEYIVEVGGEVYAKEKKSNGDFWNVGIEKPDENNFDRELKATVHLENKALATSGNYRKFYIENGVRYSHTIDPATGYPVKHSLLSVSVIADNCTDADAYATAFMVMGLEKSKTFLETHKELEAYFIYSDTYRKIKTYETEGLKELLTEK
jgi:FAD:protein FMN transferase